MHEVAWLLVAAALSGVTARATGLPLVPLLVVGGLGLGIVHPLDAEFLETALVLGVSFLLFVTGTELDPRRVRAQRSAAIRIGVVQFVVLGVAGWWVARALGFASEESLWIALALPASSTLIGVRLLQRRRQLFEPFGRLTIGALLVQDALILLAIPVVIGVEAGPATMVRGVLGVVALSLIALLVRRWVGTALVRVIDEHEVVLLCALGLLFAFIGGAGALGLPVVVGAFLSGVALSRFPVSGIIRAEVAPIGDFFTAIFFTALGALVRVPTAAEITAALVLAAVVVLVTPPLVMVLAERAGFGSRSAAESGLLLAQTSEISLVVILAGRSEGAIGESVLVVVALLTLVTMLLTPLVATDDMARRIARIRPSRRPESRGDVPHDHVLLIGAGSTGMPLLEDLVLSGVPVVVVDDDPAVIAMLADAGIPALRGEASDPAVLRAAQVSRARVVVSTIHRAHDNAPLLELAGDVPVLVRVFEREDAEWVRRHGGRPVLSSDATAEGLLEWFDENRTELEARSG